MANLYDAKFFSFSIKPFLRIFFCRTSDFDSFFPSTTFSQNSFHIFQFSSLKLSQIYLFEVHNFFKNFSFYKLKKKISSFSSIKFSQHFFLFPTFNLQQQLFCHLAHSSFFFVSKWHTKSHPVVRSIIHDITHSISNQ